MAKKPRICCTCGTQYFYCPSCSEDANKPNWMFAFHDENCKKILQISSDLLHDNIDVQEAKKRFDECDLTNKETFIDDGVKKAIELAYKTTKKQNKKQVELTTDDVKGTAEVVKDNIEVKPHVETTTKKAKRFGLG